MATTQTETERVFRAAETAYMADAYGEAAWKRIASFLLGKGHTDREAAAIMRSKHARWADDAQGAGNGKGTNSAAFVRYYDATAARGTDWLAEGRKLAAADWELDEAFEALS